MSDNRIVTVLAPTPQDAEYCRQILSDHQIPVEFVSSIYEVTARVRNEPGVLLMAQEFLTPEALRHLRAAIADQPSWSDVPILILLSKQEASSQMIADLLSLGHVTLVERPLRIALLVSTLQAKLRDRDRQYKVRDLLVAAQQASQSKSAFVANMSHEIRTPMTSILGYAKLLSGLIQDEEAKSYLTTIRRNGDFLLEILNDILDLSKIEAGKFDIDISGFDVSGLLDDVRTIMALRADERDLRLTVEYETKIPQVIQSDAKRLRQILVNLIGNAVKFTKEGEVKVMVGHRRLRSPAATSATVHSKGDRDTLRISVIDTGVGMTTEQQERLFQPFSQGDAGITQQFGGTGLGLIISKRLAAMLGGDIEFSSEFGKGSTFTLTIDIGKIGDVPWVETSERKAPVADFVEEEDIRLNANFLIVDDRRDIRFLSKHILTKAGGTVTEAEDGLLAIETVKDAIAHGETFDLILLDMQMPNLDGYETARHLRKLGYAGPIIALTADAMQGDMTKCLQAGCNDYLSKPIDANRMLKTVAEMTKP